MRQHIIDRLEQVYQVNTPVVGPEESTSYIAWLVNLDSSFVWNVRPGLPLERLKALAWGYKGSALGSVQNSHIVFLRRGLPWKCQRDDIHGTQHAWPCLSTAFSAL